VEGADAEVYTRSYRCGAGAVRASTTRKYLSSAQTLTLTLTQTQERVIYNKEVQTTAIETETPQVSEDEIRQQIMRERELEAERIAQDKELEEESVQLEKEIEQEIRGAFSFPSLHLDTRN
jgi:hypothetical protein